MIRTIIYIIEILSVLQCIHCVFGKKQRIDLLYILTVLTLWVSMELTNKYFIPVEGTLTMYCFVAIYCILCFKKKAKELIIGTAIYMILITVIQLFFVTIVLVVYNGDRLFGSLIADVCVLLFNFFVLPRFQIHKLIEWSFKRNITLYLSIGYIFCIVCDLLFKLKTNTDQEVRVGYYISLLPLIICVYILAKQWNLYQGYYELEKNELQLYKEDKKAFSGLVTKVRSNQHEINNHLTAILALHYTTDTYEELVNKQSKYCTQLAMDNKFNSLLSLYNSILPGYLFDKFSGIEKRGINVECKIMVDNYDVSIPEYYLVEMLGILLDNAAEAVEKSDYDNIVHFEIIKVEAGYEYLVRNPYRYVPSEEIELWFAYEKSSKGYDRGIGLYHLKCLCAEWHCVVTCRNVRYDNQNWIEFIIKTGS